MGVENAIIDATATAGSGCPVARSAPSRYATPIANTPLIGHVVAELASAGVRRATLVTLPDDARELARILESDGEPPLDIAYAEVPPHGSREVVLKELERALSAGPVLLHPGDALLRGQIADMQERFAAGDVDAVLPEPAPAPSAPDPLHRRPTETVLLLGPGTRPLIEQLRTRSRERDGLVTALAGGDRRIAVCPRTDDWHYTDTTEGLLDANRMMLDGLPPSEPGGPALGDDNHVQGRVSVSREATISHCTLHGPVAVAAGAVVEDSYIGPYTAIGPGARLSGVEIDNAMVLAGAEILHPGQRIQASIIGEGARITRRFELPKGLSLRLPPGAQISLS